MNDLVKEQTEFTLGLFDLTPEQTNKVLSEWAENTYEDTIRGYDMAQAKLMQLCRWESMSTEQREREAQRLREG